MSADPPGEHETKLRLLQQQQESSSLRSPAAPAAPEKLPADYLARYAAINAALNLSLTSTTEESETSAAEFPREVGFPMEQRQSPFAKKSPRFTSYYKPPSGAADESPESLAYSLESYSPQVQQQYRNPSTARGHSIRSWSSPDSLTYSSESFSPHVATQDRMHGRSILSRSQQQQQQQQQQHLQQLQQKLNDSSESPPSPVMIQPVTASGEAAPASASFSSENTDPTITTLASNEHLMLPSLSAMTLQAFPTSNEMRLWQLSELRHQGFPVGLALEVGNTKATYPCRFWAVDNSGSMLTSDGHQMLFRARSGNDRTVVVPCTRWAELQQTVEDHVKLAGLIQVSTVFRLLNDPGVKVGSQEFSVADPSTFQETKEQADKANAKKNSRRHALKKAEGHATQLKRFIERDVKKAVAALQKSRPAGATPLTPHLLEFRNRIKLVEDQLRHQDQQAVIVLATDGLPTDNDGEESEDAKEEFVDALKTLKSLPVWIVIRLCTDDKEVVDYYNNLDKMLELPLEVIDDFLGEAKEIFHFNPWLNYALPMHRCREMGYHHRIFDLLDERPLTKDEVHEFLVVLFGKKAMANAPDIHMEWNDYFTFISCINRAEGKHFRAHSRKQEHWIDMRRLNKVYGTGGSRWLLPHLSSLRKGTSDRTTYATAEI